MRSRRIHLDFHTNEHIPGIGSAFDKKQFKDTLQAAEVNSITLFSKCHHGYSYHPTAVGKMHPHLNFNLLAEQLDVCRQADIETPIYISAGYDEYYHLNDPGCAFVPNPPLSPLRVGFRRLCFNTPYLDYLCRQIEEVVDTFDTPMLFLDIVGIAPCCCRRCLEGMAAQGYNPAKPQDVLTFAAQVQRRYFEKTLAAARKNNPDMGVFQNAGHIRQGSRDSLNYISHLELESLPTGGWGYDHFPGSASYAGTLDFPYLGMTGKFHTTWGEFGGFKHPNALRYEAALIQAYGAACSVGDQLHPDGKLNTDTYQRIGLAYATVKRNEPYCIDTTPVAQVGLLSVEALKFKLYGYTRQDNESRYFRPDLGAQRMMRQRQILFDTLDDQADFLRYQAIIVPDERCIDNEVAVKLQAYLDNGGKLLCSYQAGMHLTEDKMLFGFGDYHGISEFEPEYLQMQPSVVAGRFAETLTTSPFVVYGGSINVAVNGQTLADKINPYFNRTVDRFCSHQHFPEDKRSPYPGAVIKGNVCYFANKLFTAYADFGQPMYRDLFCLALERLLGGLWLTSNLPTAAIATVRRQAAYNRWVLHLVYGTPAKRGDGIPHMPHIRDLEVIEDLPPLHDVKCELYLPAAPKRVHLAPSGKPLDFFWQAPKLSITLDELDCHQMTVIEF